MSKGKRGTLSSREIRRMGEREKAREAKKDAVAAFWALSPEERQKRVEDNEYINRIQRNGITIEDLNRAGQEGYREGAKTAADNTLRNIYAAVALVAHEKYGFGKKRCMALLNAIDERVMYAIDSKEMVQQVYDDLGIVMTLDGDPLEDRVQEKGA